MPQLTPVDFGRFEQNDTRYDASRAREAIGERANATQSAEQNFGGEVENAGSDLQHAIMATQKGKADLQSKTAETGVLNAIYRNQTVTAGQLKSGFDGLPAMTDAGYQQAIANAQVHDKSIKADDPNAVLQMHDIGGALYKDHMQQADTKAADTISLPGWRSAWLNNNALEHENTREQKVNKVLAAKQVQYLSEQADVQMQQHLDTVTSKDDFRDPKFLDALNNPMIQNDPAKKADWEHKVAVAKDTYDDKEAIRGGQTQENLDKLKDSIATLSTKAGAAAAYPGMTPEERDQHLAALKHIADGWGGSLSAQAALQKPEMILPNGKVNPKAFLADVAASTDKNHIEEMNRRAAENDREVEKANAESFNDILRFGQTVSRKNPDGTVTETPAPFSLDRVRKNPDMAAKFADLNKRDPKLVEALQNEDLKGIRNQLMVQRQNNAVDASERRAAAAEAKLEAQKADTLSTSSKVSALVEMQDNPTLFEDMGPADHTAYLHKNYPGLSDEDREMVHQAFIKDAAAKAKGAEPTFNTIRRLVGSMKLDAKPSNDLASEIFSNHAQWEQEWENDPKHGGRAPPKSEVENFIKEQMKLGVTTTPGMLWNSTDKMRRADFDTKMRTGELEKSTSFAPAQEGDYDAPKEVERADLPSPAAKTAPASPSKETVFSVRAPKTGAIHAIPASKLNAALKAGGTLVGQ